MRRAARNLGSARRAGAGNECLALRRAFVKDGFFPALCWRVGWFCAAVPAPSSSSEIRIRSENFVREVGRGIFAGDEDRMGVRCDRCERQGGSESVFLACGREN